MAHTNITKFEAATFINRRDRVATITIFAGDEVCVVTPIKWGTKTVNQRPNNGVTDGATTVVEIELRDMQTLVGNIYDIDFNNDNIIIAMGDQSGVIDRRDIKTPNFSANVIEQIYNIERRLVIIRISS